MIHYQLAASADVYVHRSGRTARGAQDGLTIALVTPKEAARYQGLQKAMDRPVPCDFPLDTTLMPSVRSLGPTLGVHVFCGILCCTIFPCLRSVMLLLRQHNLFPWLHSCSPFHDAMHAGQGFVKDLCHEYVSIDTFYIFVDTLVVSTSQW